MVKIYLKYILNGKITIDEVPQKWKVQVEEALAELEENK